MQIGFGCTACGKCCNAAPTLTISEAFEYQDDFISIPRIYSVPTNAGKEDTIANNLVYAKIQGSNQALQIGARIFAYSTNTRKCQMRDASGKCRLHTEGRKPLTCRCVPLDPGVSNIKFPDILDNRVYRSCIRSNEECHADDEIIWKDGKYCEKSSLFIAMQEEIQTMREDNKDLSKVVSLLAHEEVSQTLFGFSIMSILAENPGSSISVPITIFFDDDAIRKVDLKFNNHYISDKKRVLEFYKHQIPLLEKHIVTAEESFRGIMTNMLSVYKTIIKAA